MAKNMNFKEGDLIVYIKPDGCEIGKIKRIREEDHHGFIWFNTGDTASLVNLDFVFPVLNDYCIQELLNKKVKK